MKGVSQVAGWPLVPSAASHPVAPDPSAQDRQDDDSQPRGYFVGECGHRAPLVGAGSYVGPCDDCDPSAT